MKIMVKKLHGDSYTLEVKPETVILDVKKKVAELIRVRADEITLLLMGKPMHNESTISSYPIIIEGTKLYLVVKKRHDLRALAVRHFIRIGMNQAEAHMAGIDFINEVRERFMSMSWDDVNRLAANILGVEPSNKIDIKLLL